MYDAMQPDTARGEFENGDDMLRRYSAGELDRRSVMDALEIDYSEMLERLHQLDLEMPTVSTSRMSDMVTVIKDLPLPTGDGMPQPRKRA